MGGLEIVQKGKDGKIKYQYRSTRTKDAVIKEESIGEKGVWQKVKLKPALIESVKEAL